jgi:hypothetical protein
MKALNAAILLAVLLAISASAQMDVSGHWGARYDEDQPERIPGPELGDYLGIPLNPAARLAAQSWDASLLTLPEYQCRVHPADYVPQFSDIRIIREVDPVTQALVAFHTHVLWFGTERTIWMDGRPHPSPNALHTSQGFSTGKLEGGILTIATTHMKRAWIRRNGVPRSENATMVEHLIRHGDELTWMTVITDPAYLTEPFIRTRDFTLNVGGTIFPYPCESVVEVPRPRGQTPHHLPGTNPFLAEFAKKYNIPAEATMGGAETIYPEYKLKLSQLRSAK